MKINIGEDTRDQVRKNLLKAQERIADTGSARENIMLAKFLFKFSKKFDNKVENVGPIESKNDAEKPPYGSN